MCLIYKGSKPTDVSETFTAYKVYEVSLLSSLLPSLGLSSPAFKFRKNGLIFSHGTFEAGGVIGVEGESAIYAVGHTDDKEKNLYPVEDEAALNNQKVNVYAFHCVSTKEDAEKYLEDAKFYQENEQTVYAIVTIQLRREDLVAWGYTTVRLLPIHFDKDTFAIAGFGNILTYCAKKITITEEDFNNAINQS